MLGPPQRLLGLAQHGPVEVDQGGGHLGGGPRAADLRGAEEHGLGGRDDVEGWIDDRAGDDDEGRELELELVVTRRLGREEGLFVGLSSGGACASALEVARDAEPGSVIVFIVPDRGDKYLSMETLFGP